MAFPYICPFCTPRSLFLYEPSYCGRLSTLCMLLHTCTSCKKTPPQGWHSTYASTDVASVSIRFARTFHNPCNPISYPLHHGKSSCAFAGNFGISPTAGGGGLGRLRSSPLSPSPSPQVQRGEAELDLGTWTWTRGT